ncbi:Cytochrome p450 protein [Neofusicoccum parvum]|uniref:Cytochrome p450 protein n=1 Tax=Neofusicoccum parvum TaxID=310453 RepID=A0ACB5SMB3_9PEZI|nr:Cytochrome p450 protein [Neofusicoccum parvum]
MTASTQLRVLSLHNVSAPQLLATVLFLAAFSFLARIIYNLYFHPLAKYPGPRLAAATSLVWWFKWITGSTLLHYESAHNQCGEIVRIAPDRISFTNPQAWKDIYGHRTGNVKDDSFYGPDFNGRHSLLSIQSDAEHTRVRRIFTHAFSDKALRDQEDLIRHHIDKLIKSIHIQAGKGAEMNLVKLYNCTTFDVMADLTFGEPLGLLDNSEYSPWLESILGGIKFATYQTLMLEYPLLNKLVSLLTPPKVVEQFKKAFEYSAQRVENRMAKGVTERPDIWSLVLGKEEGKGLDIEDMNANASLFMVAGSETTATLLSGLTYHLLLSPEKMSRLVEEIRSTFADEKDLTIDNLRRLTYLNACFEEGLRVYPPAPSGLPRTISKGGSTILGHYFPEKTRVSLPQWASYRYPANFTNPLVFAPERWLPDDPEYPPYAHDNREILQPFSYGPRNCIGKNLAYHEMRLILAKTLWHFNLELCPQSRGTWLRQKTWWGLWEKPPLWVRAKSVRG